MSRWLPYPVISAVLLVTWLLLNQSLSLGQILLGGVLSIIGPWFLVRLDTPRLSLKRPRAMLQLLSEVILDIIRSNYRVATLVVRDKPGRTPGFVRIPLKLQSQYGLAALACIITATPGTTWVSYDPNQHILVIHVLDLVDEDDWAAIIKTRYERLLMEIFE